MGRKTKEEALPDADEGKSGEGLGEKRENEHV
jgi:hypothetical protein